MRELHVHVWGTERTVEGKHVSLFQFLLSKSLFLFLHFANFTFSAILPSAAARPASHDGKQPLRTWTRTAAQRSNNFSYPGAVHCVRTKYARARGHILFFVGSLSCMYAVYARSRHELKGEKGKGGRKDQGMGEGV